MPRILKHILDEKKTNCKICGSTVDQITTGFTCIWRNEDESKNSLIRPEPKEREYAIYNSEIISLRIKELILEKNNMINHVDEDKSESKTDWNGLLA